MKPDASYIKLQRELKTLIQRNDCPKRRNTVEAQLESKFVAAWRLETDHRRLAYNLGQDLRIMPGRRVSGFDHCTFYTTADELIIVTQPYGDHASDLKRNLTLEDGTSPEIIVATDWTFWYPGRTDLIIMRFPHYYPKELATFKELTYQRTWQDAKRFSPAADRDSTFDY